MNRRRFIALLVKGAAAVGLAGLAKYVPAPLASYSTVAIADADMARKGWTLFTTSSIPCHDVDRYRHVHAYYRKLVDGTHEYYAVTWYEDPPPDRVA